MLLRVLLVAAAAAAAAAVAAANVRADEGNPFAPDPVALEDAMPTGCVESELSARCLRTCGDFDRVAHCPTTCNELMRTGITCRRPTGRGGGGGSGAASALLGDALDALVGGARRAGDWLRGALTGGGGGGGGGGTDDGDASYQRGGGRKAASAPAPPRGLRRMPKQGARPATRTAKQYAPLPRRRWRTTETGVRQQYQRLLRERVPAMLANISYIDGRKFWAWTPDNLGRRSLLASGAKHSSASPRFGIGCCPLTNVTVAEFWRRARAGAAATPREYWYASLPVERLGPRPNKDLDDIHFVKAMLGERTPFNLWMASDGAVTPLHYDAFDNFYVQLTGSKRWRVLPPAYYRKLHVYPKGHVKHRQSQLGSAAPDALRAADAERFPHAAELAAGWQPEPEPEAEAEQQSSDDDAAAAAAAAAAGGGEKDVDDDEAAASATKKKQQKAGSGSLLHTLKYPLEFETHPGDILYLPAFWFHEVESVGETLALNRWYTPPSVRELDRAWRTELPVSDVWSPYRQAMATRAVIAYLVETVAREPVADWAAAVLASRYAPLYGAAGGAGGAEPAARLDVTAGVESTDDPHVVAHLKEIEMLKAEQTIGDDSNDYCAPPRSAEDTADDALEFIGRNFYDALADLRRPWSHRHAAVDPVVRQLYLEDFVEDLLGQVIGDGNVARYLHRCFVAFDAAQHPSLPPAVDYPTEEQIHAAEDAANQRSRDVYDKAVADAMAADTVAGGGGAAAGGGAGEDADPLAARQAAMRRARAATDAHRARRVVREYALDEVESYAIDEQVPRIGEAHVEL